MKTISVGELRQNPTPMLDDVAAGETYLVTRHSRGIAKVVPTASSASVIPPRHSGPATTRMLNRVELPEDLDIDGLLDELKGEW